MRKRNYRRVARQTIKNNNNHPFPPILFNGLRKGEGGLRSIFTIMYSQSFSPIELYKCTTQVERRNLKKKKEEIVQAIRTEIGDSISDGIYQFQIRHFQNLFLNAYHKKSFSYLSQNLVLRKLYKNIKFIYSVKQTDRNNIVKQMKLLLSEKVDMWIIRLDIKHFYETINRDKILTKLIEDARLSYESLLLLNSLFSNPVISSGSGLPRGLGISSVLSELYLKYFDLELKKCEGVYYYARFVDDIIVFCSSEKSHNLVWNFACEELKKLGLDLNMAKSVSLKPNKSGIVFTYLGYYFCKLGGKLRVTIDKKKLKVIKTRLTKSFVRFSKEHDFELLKSRIKFLTGNFTLYNPSTLLPIKVGIYFNYKMATSVGELAGLDAYYQKLLHCLKWHSSNGKGLNKRNIKDLEKYSFQFGYRNHVNHYFNDRQMSEITNCWR